MPRMARRRAAPRGPARRTTRRTVNRHQRRRRTRRRRVLVGGMMVVGTGALAYKMGSSQKKQVEEASGTPIEEMTDEEIQQYVDKYNIQVEPLDAAEQQTVAQAGPVEEYDVDDEPAAPDYTEELQKLASLRDSGVLTEEEFQAKKQQILGI